MSTKLINNADDFGYSNAINYGIIDSHKYGILTSTTIMAGMPGFEHAVELAKKNPGLGIGVHCTLTCGKPVLNSHKTLVDEFGYFKKLSFYENIETSVDDEEVYLEWKAQIEKVIQAGIKPTHLDSHHHIHTFKNNTKIIIRLAKEYGLPVRNSYQDPDVYKKEGVRCNDILLDPWKRNEEKIKKSSDVTKSIVSEVKEVLTENKDLEVIEFMWHPAYMDIHIMEGSGFNLPRIYELNAIIQKELGDYIKENFILSTYKDL